MSGLGPRRIELPEFRDPERGALAVTEINRSLPFAVKRAFHIYDFPVGIQRGGHAHRTCEQFLLCVAGAIELIVTSPAGRTDFVLDQPRIAIHLPRLNWVEFQATRPGTVCLVLTSDVYDPADYINDRDEFAALLSAER